MKPDLPALATQSRLAARDCTPPAVNANEVALGSEDVPGVSGKPFTSVLDVALTRPRHKARGPVEVAKNNSRRATASVDSGQPHPRGAVGANPAGPTPHVSEEPDETKAPEPSGPETSKAGTEKIVELPLFSPALVPPSIPSVPLPISLSSRPQPRGCTTPEAQASPATAAALLQPVPDRAEKVAAAGSRFCPVAGIDDSCPYSPTGDSSPLALAAVLAPSVTENGSGETLEKAQKRGFDGPPEAPNPDPRSKLSASVPTGLAPVANTAGMFSAEGAKRMNAELTPNEFAALTMDSLPATENPTPLRGARDLALGRQRVSTSLTPDFSRIELPTLRLPNAVEPCALTEVSKPAVITHLFEGIVHETTLMRSLQPDSLAVVLKPDDRTEIFIRLDVRDGQLQAVARCERGDFQFLNSHWTELQRSLKDQGVHLQDLQQRPESSQLGTGSTSSGPGNHDRFPFAREQETPAAKVGRPAKRGAVVLRPPGSTLHLKRLLESWA